MKQATILLIFLASLGIGHAQSTDTLSSTTANYLKSHSLGAAFVKMEQKKERLRAVVIPTVLIAYGFISLDSDPLESMDHSIESEIREDHPHFHTHIDNYMQYAPAFAVYALNAVGIKGKNNFRDRTMIYLIANLITGTTVQSLKAATGVPRPDGGHNAFPSGHTATAFAAAEFLRQEYKDVSPLYGVAGYLMAAGTGALRMYNNVHWLKDVIAGAGIGMLSTKVAYWIYPSIKKKIFPHSSAMAMIMPTYEGGGWGASMMFAINL